MQRNAEIGVSAASLLFDVAERILAYQIHDVGRRLGLDDGASGFKQIA
jgi:hypothetical protein